MDPLNLRKTNTTKFILAMIFNNETKHTDILENNFIDSYTYDFYEPENDGYIIVVKSTNDTPSETINKPIREYPRGKHYLFVYEVPDQYLDDHVKILNGEYENLSSEYKLKLINFWDEDWNVKSEFIKLLVVHDRVKSKVFKFNPFEEIYRKRKLPRDIDLE
jgi:hypothetical protein